jgi:hypothetical protein
MLLIAVVFCYATLGAPALNLLGYAYKIPGNSLIERFHPATYLVVLLLLRILTAANGGSALMRAMRSAGPAAWFAVISLTCAALVAQFRDASGTAYLVDTFTAPALLAVLLRAMAPRQVALASGVALACLLLNATIAMGEALTHRSLIGAEYSGAEFRATALLGHPLINALITAPAILLLVAGTGSGIGKILAIIVLLGGLLAFSGRAALILVLFFILVGFGVELHRFLVSGRVRSSAIRLYAVLFVLAPVWIVVLLSTTSIGDRLVSLLYFDESAGERVTLLSLFRDLSADRLWFGSNADEIAAFALSRAGLPAIENFWAYLLLHLGLLLFVPFTLGLAWFLRGLARGRGAGAALAMLVFVAIASTSNSLSSNTTAVGVLVILLSSCGARRRASPVAGGLRPAAASAGHPNPARI